MQNVKCKMENGKIGSVLREKREELGLMIEEVERRAFLPKRYLIAIENDDISVFPKISSATQIIRAYSRFLGLKDYEIANLIREFNPSVTPKFILFGKNSLVYIILLLILFVIVLVIMAL